MAKPGLAKVEEAKADGTWQTPRSRPRNVRVPEPLRMALAENTRAKANFEAMATSYRDSYSAWVAAAKTNATRRKRVAEALEKLERNEKLGLK